MRKSTKVAKLVRARQCCHTMEEWHDNQIGDQVSATQYARLWRHRASAVDFIEQASRLESADKLVREANPRAPSAQSHRLLVMLQ